MVQVLQENNKTGLISLSGGMDSTTLLYYAVNKGYKMNAIGFDYGQNHKKELELAKWHCQKLNVPFEIIKLDFLNKISNSSLTNGSDLIPEGHYEEDNMKSTVVPFRNGIFLSILASYAEANNIKYIFLGNHAGDHAVYPDCRGEFIDSMTSAIKEGTYNNVTINAPFTDITKSDICRLGLKLNINYKKTWSCYKGDNKPCGKCGTCTERTQAFLDNSEIDPLYTKEQWVNAVNFYNNIKKGDIYMNKYDYTIVSTCSKTKRDDCKLNPIPLREMYVGTVGRLKLRISEFLLDNHYYISPMGPGLVPKNSECMWYDSLTPEKMMKDPKFIEYHRKKAIQADPDIIKFKTIYFIGHSRYFEFLKNVLKGQQVKYLLGKPYPIFAMSNIIENTLATQYTNYNAINIFNVDENKKIVKLRCVDDNRIVISVVMDDNFKYIKRYDVEDYTNSKGFKEFLINENYVSGSYKKFLDRYKNSIKVKKNQISNIKIQFDLQEILTNYTYDDVIVNRIRQRMKNANKS